MEPQRRIARTFANQQDLPLIFPDATDLNSFGEQHEGLDESPHGCLRQGLGELPDQCWSV